MFKSDAELLKDNALATGSRACDCFYDTPIVIEIINGCQCRDDYLKLIKNMTTGYDHVISGV